MNTFVAIRYHSVAALETESSRSAGLLIPLPAAAHVLRKAPFRYGLETAASHAVTEIARANSDDPSARL